MPNNCNLARAEDRVKILRCHIILLVIRLKQLREHGDCLQPSALTELDHNSNTTFLIPAIMRMFALLYSETDEGRVFLFPMRRAENASDYLIALLLEEKQEESSMLTDFLLSVVLRHVWDANASSITVSGYDADTDSMILLDSAPSRKAMTDIPFARSSSILGMRLSECEQITSDRYVVPLSKIFANIGPQGDTATWTLMQHEELETCPRYGETTVSKAASMPSKKRQYAVEE